MKQLPDWLRRAMGLPDKFRRGHGKWVPWEVEAVLNQVLEQMLAGSGRDLQCTSTVKMKILMQTAQKIFDAWKEVSPQIYDKDRKGSDLLVAMHLPQPRLNRRYVQTDALLRIPDPVTVC